MTTPLIAGNWKMNKLPSEARAWLERLLATLGTSVGNIEILLNVPFTHLPLLAGLASGTPVKLGAQDVSTHSQGAYTGEVSAAMLKDVGASYVIVGHSERRNYHHESDEMINGKIRAVLGAGMKPILCIGESEGQRAAGQANSVVIKQLQADLAGIFPTAPEELVIAYEPIWAIGTGKTATKEDAQEMSATIRRALGDLYPHHAEAIRILYGGSMKPDNAAELLAEPDINGGLIGGASLDIEAFFAIIRAAQ